LLPIEAGFFFALHLPVFWIILLPIVPNPGHGYNLTSRMVLDA